MARCYYLDYESTGWLSGNHICTLCGKRMDSDSAQVKYTCDAAYGDEYKKCPIYQSKS